MEKVYILLREVVGGEEEDQNSSRIVAVRSDILALIEHVPSDKFVCVDPEYLESLDWDAFYPNSVARFVIRGFFPEIGKEMEEPSTFWSVEDFKANGLDITD